MIRFQLAILTVIASIVTFDRSTCGMQQEYIFPVTAEVVQDNVKVFSGPGAMHYPTAHLQPGDEVQVWRMDPGGWCAIRPPADSFCLVPANSIHQEEDGSGTVLTEGTQVWVGTQLGAVEQPLWQVKLSVEEPVQILGEVSWPNPDGEPSVWLQIEPPAGEFRWIHRDAIRLPEPKAGGGRVRSQQSVLNRTEARKDSAVVPAAAFTAVQEPTMLDDPFAGLEPPMAKSNLSIKNEETGLTERIDQERDFENLQQQPKLRQGSMQEGFVDLDIESEIKPAEGKSLGESGWRPAKSPIRLAANNSVEPSLAMLPGRWESRSGSPPPVSSVPGGSSRPGFDMDPVPQYNAHSLPTFGPDRPIEELASLDVRISTEIIKPPEYWHLDQIAGDLVRVQSTANSDQARTQAALMLKKIEGLQRTRSNLLSTGTSASVASIASKDRPVGSSLDTSVELGSTYDAYGWLNQLTQENGAVEPAYVLQDSTGRITHEVSPAPGLNLNRYLKSQVGIVGQRGFNQKLKLNHVTADRVIVLEKGATTARRFR